MKNSKVLQLLANENGERQIYTIHSPFDEDYGLSWLYANGCRVRSVQLFIYGDYDIDYDITGMLTRIDERIGKVDVTILWERSSSTKDIYWVFTMEPKQREA